MDQNYTSLTSLVSAYKFDHIFQLIPYFYEYLSDEAICWNPKLAAKFLNSTLEKTGPLSLLRIFEIPYFEKFSFNTFITRTAVNFLHLKEFY